MGAHGMQTGHVACGTSQATGISQRKCSNTDLHIIRVSDLTEQAQNLPISHERVLYASKVNAALMEV